ncbi:MAG: FtsX-like permease family protein [Bowdeniella nasicola]|nr:FtsX-like permease family protein [Bowdeniella nasicola]
MWRLIGSPIKSRWLWFTFAGALFTLAIALLTVAFATPTLITSAVLTQRALDYGQANVVVDPGVTLTREDAERVGELPGMRAVALDITGIVRVETDKGARIEQFVPATAATFARYTLISGSAPARGGEVALTAHQSATYNAPIGADITVKTPVTLADSQTHPELDSAADASGSSVECTLEGCWLTELLTVTGIVSDPPPLLGSAHRMVLSRTDIDEWARLGALATQADRLLVQAIDADAACATIARELGPEYPARDVWADAHRAAQVTRQSLAVVPGAVIASAVLTLIGAGSVLAAVLAITIDRSEWSRRLLRRLGASPRHLRAVVLLIAGALGLISGLAGLATGSGLSAAAVSYLANLAPEPLPRASVSLDPVHTAVTLAISVLVALAAGAVPATRAGAISLLPEPEGDDHTGGARWRRNCAQLGAGIVVVGGILTLAAAARLRTYGTSPVLSPLALVALAGILLAGAGIGVVATPQLLRATEGFIERCRVLLPRELRLSSRLAGSSLAHTRTILGTATGAIVVLTTIGVGLATTSATVHSTGEEVWSRSAAFDLTVRSDAPASAADLNRLRETVAALPGVRDVAIGERAMMLASTEDGHNAELPVIGVPQVELALTTKDADLASQLTGNVLVLGRESPLPAHTTTVDIAGTEGGPTLRLDVVHSTGWFSALLARPTFDRIVHSPGTGVAFAALIDDTQPLTARAAAAAFDADAIAGSADLSGAAIAQARLAVPLRLLDLVIGGVLLLIALLVSLTWTTVTTRLAVGRSRRARMLYTLGMRRTQIRAAIALQSLALTMVAGLGGTALGLGAGQAACLALLHEAELPVHLSIPWDSLALLWLALFATATLTALIPSRAFLGLAPRTLRS